LGFVATRLAPARYATFEAFLGVLFGIARRVRLSWPVLRQRNRRELRPHERTGPL